MNITQDDNKFLAEAFIMEMNINQYVDYTTALTPENLVSIRKLCAVKHMARQQVNMSLDEAAEYIETDNWNCGQGSGVILLPGVSLFLFFLQTNIDKVVFYLCNLYCKSFISLSLYLVITHLNIRILIVSPCISCWLSGEYNQHETQGDTINMRIFKWVITR